MLMNGLERFLMNNPVRTALMHGTVRWLHDVAGPRTLGHVLEVGCGQGEGIRQIDAAFRPHRIDAFDLDPLQIARARRRLDTHPVAASVQLWVGDVERMPVPDATYDAVFELGILHHVPRWVRALDEIRRVLKPGGLFLFEELSREFFEDVPVLGPLVRRFTVHPWEAMFDTPAFRRGLADARLHATSFRTHALRGWHRGAAVAR